MIKLSSIILLINACGNTDRELERISVIIDSVRQEHAPDARTCVYRVEAGQQGKSIVIRGETSLPAARDALLASLQEAGLVTMMELNLLPDSSVGTQVMGVVNNSVANIRSRPAHRADMATQAILGTPVRVLKNKGGWYLVQTPDNYLGWVDRTAVHALSESSFNRWRRADKIIYARHAGRVMDPENPGLPVSDITAGSLLESTGEKGGYYQVVYPDGRMGLVAGPEALPYQQWLDQHQFHKEDILETAMQFMGYPYLWGGTSTKGIDCSGFTRTVYYLNGIILQRDASQQALYGEAISTEDGFALLEPGDLLFFGDPPEDGGEPRITHVGIYVGDLSFIHSAGRVWLDSFDPQADNYNEYRRNTLVSARRILNSINTPGITPVATHELYLTN